MVFSALLRLFSVGAGFRRLIALSSVLQRYLLFYDFCHLNLPVRVLAEPCEVPKNSWYNVHRETQDNFKYAGRSGHGDDRKFHISINSA